MVLIFCLFVLCIINAFYTSELQFLQRHARHDTDRTVLSSLVWRCGYSLTRACRKVMAAYRRVYDSRHLLADCQEPGSAPTPYARQSSMGYLYVFIA